MITTSIKRERNYAIKIGITHANLNAMTKKQRTRAAKLIVKLLHICNAAAQKDENR